MKTYSRRKAGESVEEEIIDLDEVCRLCMEKEGELVSIFSNEETIPLTLRIMACVALEVFEGDGLPDKICQGCKFQLEKSYIFRKKCEQSDMKLRVHLREIKEKLGSLYKDKLDVQTNDSIQVDLSADDSMQSDDNRQEEEEPSTEADLVGVTKVAYIPGDDQEPDSNHITLPLEGDSKEACTLKSTEQLKNDPGDIDNEDNIFIIEENDEDVEETNIGAIADAVKATLANEPDINVGEQFQLTVNPSKGKTTQVEVVTEDGHTIIMEVMTEDETPKTNDLEFHTVLDDQVELNEDGELKVFQCPECPKSFSRRIQLRRHASVHMEQKGFSCGICEKWFPTRSALVRHERIHTGERPFQCEVCSRSFAQKEILFRHLMTHTGQRPYTCTYCPKGFNQKEQLRLHIKKHANSPNDIQLHYCSLCPKVFCHASGLSRHLVTHTGKTFKCGECDKTFTDKSSLRRHHLQNVH